MDSLFISYVGIYMYTLFLITGLYILVHYIVVIDGELLFYLLNHSFLYL